MLLDAKLLQLQVLHLIEQLPVFSLGPARILVFKVTFYAVLLVILFLGFRAHDAAQLVNRIVKLPLQVGSLDAKVTADQANSVELALDFIDARDVVKDQRVVTSNWFAIGEALEDVLHDLLFSLHCDHTRQHEVKIHTASTAFVLFGAQVKDRVAEVGLTALLDAGL